MKKNLIITAAAGLFLTATIALFSFNKSVKSTEYRINFTPAKTSNELVALRNNSHANVIKTLSQFDNILALNESPLNALPKRVVDEFRSQLVVRAGVGIVGLKYGTIKSLLSDADFATVMATFGIDTKNGFWGFSANENVINSVRGKRLKAIFEDYKEYQCVSSHNCSKMADYICLTGC
jgi:hypothetical protein